jgi:hypothetical protein
VLQPLLAMGIRPDMVTALDYSPVSQRFYEGLGELPDVTLVLDPKVHPVVPDNYPGPVRMFRTEMLGQVIDEIDDERDALQAGSTVAHLNFYLARYMGCDPIVLIGQDLGFGENVYYSPGTAIHTTWAGELNRFNTLEMMEWQRIVRMRRMLRKVPGQDGREIYTDSQMFTYIQQFERDFAATEATVINATEGGARLDAAEQESLAEVARRLPDRDAPAHAIPNRTADARQQAEAGARSLRARLDELDKMDEICREVLKPLRKMTGELNNPKQFNRLHAKMNRWRLKIDDYKRIYKLVSDVTQIAELRRYQMDKALVRRKLEEVEERREQLSRDIHYVSTLQHGIEAFRRSLREALARLEAVR